MYKASVDANVLRGTHTHTLPPAPEVSPEDEACISVVCNQQYDLVVAPVACELHAESPTTYR